MQLLLLIVRACIIKSEDRPGGVLPQIHLVFTAMELEKEAHMNILRRIVLMALAITVLALIFIPLQSCSIGGDGLFNMNTLVAYPDYPEQIAVNHDYEVTVIQEASGKKIDLKVYNTLRQAFINKARAPYGDDYRRFCEFAYSGSHVKVEIKVFSDFSSYTVMPSSYELMTDVYGNVISVWLDEPKTFMIKLDNDLNSILTVFAEAPEKKADIPDRDDPGIIYIEGWRETEDKTLTVTSGQTLYLAPGSVLNARVLVSGDNIKILGRGMIRDPYDVRTFNDHGVNYNLNVTNSKNVIIKDIKIVDCRFYHLYLGDSADSDVSGVKLMSNQISTDGFKIFNCSNVSVRNCYAHVGDDVFPITGDNSNILIDGCIVGTSCGIMTMRGNMTNVKYSNIDVFRADEAIFKNLYSPGDNQTSGIILENFNAVDCDFVPFLLRSKGQGKGTKHFIFNNVSIIKASGTDNKLASSFSGNMISLEDGADYIIDINNMWIDNKPVNSASDIKVNDKSSNKAVINIKNNDPTGLGVIRNTLELEVPAAVNKINVGGYKLPLQKQPYEQDGSLMVPVDEIMKVMGIQRGNNPAETADVSGMVPFESLAGYGLEATYDGAAKNIYIKNIHSGGNLLDNGGFEDGIFNWTTANFAMLELTDDSASGSKALHVYKLGSDTGKGAGRQITDIIQRCGSGTYRIDFSAKSGFTGYGSKIKMRFIYIYQNGSKLIGTEKEVSFSLIQGWRPYSAEISVPPNTLPAAVSLLFVNQDERNIMDYYLDDVSIVKIAEHE